MNETRDIHSEVQNYYGKELTSSKDLKTNACCTIQSFPDYIRKAMFNVHEEVSAKYYGCGLVVPTDVRGKKILDLGSGSGRDCYILSQLVGETGEVVGVDMTDEQLAVANKHINWHQEKFGYKKSNVRFIKGNIDLLEDLDLPKNYFDIIISNCVINLTKDKQKVLNNAYDLLAQGGEMYFSDVYSDRRIPTELQNDPVLYGECLSGALYWNDFLRYANKAGFPDVRKVSASALTIQNSEVEKKVGGIQFSSNTYRLFKIDALEDACEDFGQAVRYKGTLPESPVAFSLDDGHLFDAGKIYHVCGNTYLMLEKTRFREHFEFYGDWSTHYGIFPDCGTPANTSEESAGSGSCC